jgi:hypothetical protein
MGFTLRFIRQNFFSNCCCCLSKYVALMLPPLLRLLPLLLLPLLLLMIMKALVRQPDQLALAALYPTSSVPQGCCCA